jgi:hypothetical protein
MFVAECLFGVSTWVSVIVPENSRARELEHVWRHLLFEHSQSQAPEPYECYPDNYLLDRTRSLSLSLSLSLCLSLCLSYIKTPIHKFGIFTLLLLPRFAPSSKCNYITASSHGMSFSYHLAEYLAVYLPTNISLSLPSSAQVISTKTTQSPCTKLP